MGRHPFLEKPRRADAEPPTGTCSPLGHDPTWVGSRGLVTSTMRTSPEGKLQPDEKGAVENDSTRPSGRCTSDTEVSDDAHRVAAPPGQVAAEEHRGARLVMS